MPTATVNTPKAVHGMVAVSRDSGIKPLGYVCWFSVPDEDLKLSRLRYKWVRSGLDAKPLPPAQKSINAFRRAVRQQEGITVNERDDTKTETDVREFPETAERAEYQVTRVTRNMDERRIVYSGAIRVWFDKADEKLDMSPLGDVPFKEARAIMDSIKEAYEATSESVPGSKVRSIVRGILRDDDTDKSFGFSGENLRGKAGGIYFVFAKHEHNLERLSDLLWTLWPGGEGRAYLHIIPLADGKSERELIRSHHRMNSMDDLDEAMFDMAKLLRDQDAAAKLGKTLTEDQLWPRGRSVRDNVLKHHQARLEQFQLRAAEYADALGGEQKDIQTRLKTLGEMMVKVRLLG
jgi:hypothetical protein